MIGMSDIYIVACRTAPNVISSIAVPLHSPGLSFGTNERKMGWKSQPTRVVRFDAVRVPKDHLYVFFSFRILSSPINRLGKEGDGFKIAMTGLDGGRLLIGACSLGAADACLEILLNHLEGKKIDQTTSFALADMYGKLHQSRLLVR